MSFVPWLGALTAAARSPSEMQKHSRRCRWTVLKSLPSVPAVRGRFSGLPRTQSRASCPRECFWRAEMKPPALLAEMRAQLQQIISWLTHLYPQKIFHPYPISHPASTSPSLSPTSRARFRRPGTRELKAGRRAPPATTTGSCGTPPAATPPAAHRDSAR